MHGPLLPGQTGNGSEREQLAGSSTSLGSGIGRPQRPGSWAVGRGWAVLCSSFPPSIPWIERLRCWHCRETGDGGLTHSVVPL